MNTDTNSKRFWAIPPGEDYPTASFVDATPKLHLENERNVIDESGKMYFPFQENVTVVMEEPILNLRGKVLAVIPNEQLRDLFPER
jgi:hypothetical protein